jgi:dynactin 1
MADCPYLYSVVSGVAPWLLRVEEIKALAAVNVDAERKIVKLNEEMQELVRGIKNRVSAMCEIQKYF